MRLPNHQVRTGRFISVLTLRGGFDRYMQDYYEEELSDTSLNCTWDIKAPPSSTKLGPLQMTWGMGSKENWMLREEIKENLKEIYEDEDKVL